MVKKYYFGNWKMYQTFSSVKKFVKDLKADKDWQNRLDDRYVGIAASYEHLYFLAQKLGNSFLLQGAQDCSQFTQGAYTGQVSVQSLLDVNIDFCIIGHNEARFYLEQSHEQIALKFKVLLAAGISPILCIGENLVEKEEGRTLEILFDQLEIILEILKKYTGTIKIFIAYEPVYAIGTGMIPSQKDLQDVFGFLQQLKNQVLIPENILFLYGGSVSSKTVISLQQINELSGFLIGKSSIDFQELKKIVEL